MRGNVFTVRGREFADDCRTLHLHYSLDDTDLVETFHFPPGPPPDPARRPALARAAELVHWVAGVSYWKATCPPTVDFESSSPDEWQAAWLSRYWREGLAEFAWRNRLDASIWPVFNARKGRDSPPGPGSGLSPRALVPMGGGKDSLVALERVRRARVATLTSAVSGSPLIATVAATAGVEYRPIRRRLDPALDRFNRAGAWNGHVPITAINAAALVVLALLDDCRWVVFANERSADEPTLVDFSGQAVNHQFSKSHGFEKMLAQWLERYVAPDLAVFSILRRDGELGICREFAGLTRYHRVFSSCNRNFHLDGQVVAGRWCRRCPKCHFVFLGLAPFMTPATLSEIFGANLLADPANLAGFRALLALDGEKPFECVGEAAESRAALAALAQSQAWSGFPVVRELARVLQSVRVPDFDSLLIARGPHLIPGEFPQ